MLKKVFRVVLTVCGMLLGYGVSTYLVDNWDVLSGLQSTERILAVVLFTGIIGIIFFNFFSILSNQGRRVANSVAAAQRRRSVPHSTWSYCRTGDSLPYLADY